MSVHTHTCMLQDVLPHAAPIQGPPLPTSHHPCASEPARVQVTPFAPPGRQQQVCPFHTSPLRAQVHHPW